MLARFSSPQGYLVNKFIQANKSTKPSSPLSSFSLSSGVTSFGAGPSFGAFAFAEAFAAFLGVTFSVPLPDVLLGPPDLFSLLHPLLFSPDLSLHDTSFSNHSSTT